MLSVGFDTCNPLKVKTWCRETKVCRGCFDLLVAIVKPMHPVGHPGEFQESSAQGDRLPVMMVEETEFDGKHLGFGAFGVDFFLRFLPASSSPPNFATLGSVESLRPMDHPIKTIHKWFSRLDFRGRGKLPRMALNLGW